LATGLVCDALVWYAPARSRKFIDPWVLLAFHDM
jgi:hypothetical protein